MVPACTAGLSKTTSRFAELISDDSTKCCIVAQNVEFKDALSKIPVSRTANWSPDHRKALPFAYNAIEFRNEQCNNFSLSLQGNLMSRALAESLDLELAWARLKFDRPDRSFLSHPFLLELVELDLPAWLEQIKRRIVDGYVPSTALTVQAPKGNWQVRPGAYLRLEDEVVFNALVGHHLARIEAELRNLQGDPDIAYQLPRGVRRREWVRRGFPVWREWREKSKQRIEGGARFVLFADIAAFYENIDLSRLASDSRRVGFDDESATLLSDCLNRWAQPRGKGIPQGFSAADILAKVYLSSVDRNLRHEGFHHLRYVDDIRIFCNSHREAQNALLALTELLRVRGLNVQSAKTYIVEAAQAILEIDGVGPIISEIRADLQAQIREEAAGAYGTVADLERIVEENPENPPVEVLERAFEQYFLQQEPGFDKSLFHFLLTRLGAIHSRIAIEFCMRALSLRPEETEHVLKYFEKIGLQPEEHDVIAEFLSSNSAIYHYQNYQILKFYFENDFLPQRVLGTARAYFRDLTKPYWLRAYASAIIGQIRDAADMEFLEANYPQCRDDIERATCICSATGLEARRRNEFLGRVRRDGDLEERACRYVRADSGPAKEPQPVFVANQ
jgi:hypothetical protein